MRKSQWHNKKKKDSQIKLVPYLDISTKRQILYYLLLFDTLTSFFLAYQFLVLEKVFQFMRIADEKDSDDTKIDLKAHHYTIY